jgi:subtilase family serine protease
LFLGGGTQTVSTTWPSATAGQHTIKLTVDSKNQYSEPDETNNTATQTFTVPPAGKSKIVPVLEDRKPISAPRR